MGRILIADDSRFMIRLIEEILTKGGHTVIAKAQNGEQAVDHYKDHTPDLVLMDYNMPKMNGLDAARSILRHDKNARIIMVTSVNEKRKIFEALRIGVKNYVTKPVEEGAFLTILAKVLGVKASSISKKSSSDATVIMEGSFGRYLVQKNIISQEQLMDLLKIQSYANKKIGELASEDGLLNEKDVEKILMRQKRSTTRYFGQLAVQMGFLQRFQLHSLLKKQKNLYVSFEDILIREKIFSKEGVEKEQNLFKKKQQEGLRLFSSQWWNNQLQNGYIFQAFIEQTIRLFIRMLNTNVIGGNHSFDFREMVSLGTVVKIGITGDNIWDYYINIDENLATSMRKSALGGSQEVSNEDIVKEFVNIATGNALGKLEKHVQLAISMPEYLNVPAGEKFVFPEKFQTLHLPIIVSMGKIELVIAGENIRQ